MNASPYSWNRPVTDEKMFFGSEDIIDRIVNGYKGGNSNSFAIIGGRRIGKTSLLFQIKSRLLQTQSDNSGAHPKIYPVFVDAQALPTTYDQSRSKYLVPQHIIYQRILKVLLDDYQLKAQITFRIFKEGNYLEEFQAALKMIIRKTLTANDKILIIIDELEALHEYGWLPHFLGNLCSLLNDAFIGPHLDVMIAGSSLIYKYIQGPGSLFSRVAEFIRLKVLDEPEAMSLINQPTKNQLAKKVAVKIYEETGGHPYLIQYLMNELWSGFSDKFNQSTNENIDDIIQNYLEHTNIFEHWTDSFNDDSQRIYNFIAGRNKPVSLNEIRQSIGISIKIINDALDILCHTGVVRRSWKRKKNSYEIAGRMYRDWFLENLENKVMEFDVFLAYKQEDKAEVLRIAEQLKKYGISPWLEEWELKHGEGWMKAIHQQIRHTKSCAVFIGKGSYSNYQNSELKSIIDQFVRRGRPIIPVILRSSKGLLEIPEFLQSRISADFREQGPKPMESLIWGITGMRKNMITNREFRNEK